MKTALLAGFSCPIRAASSDFDLPLLMTKESVESIFILERAVDSGGLRVSRGEHTVARGCLPTVLWGSLSSPAAPLTAIILDGAEESSGLRLVELDVGGAQSALIFGSDVLPMQSAAWGLLLSNLIIATLLSFIHYRSLSDERIV